MGLVCENYGSDKILIRIHLVFTRVKKILDALAPLKVLTLFQI